VHQCSILRLHQSTLLTFGGFPLMLPFHMTMPPCLEARGTAALLKFSSGITLVGLVNVPDVVAANRRASQIGLILDRSPPTCYVFPPLEHPPKLDTFALICSWMTNGGGWRQIFAFLISYSLTNLSTPGCSVFTNCVTKSSEVSAAVGWLFSGCTLHQDGFPGLPSYCPSIHL